MEPFDTARSPSSQAAARSRETPPGNKKVQRGGHLRPGRLVESIGRLAYSRPDGPVVLPVNYKLHEGTIVFRSSQDGPVGDDLRTGIAEAEYKVAFEIDSLGIADREGWFVFIHGPAHHVDSDAERASVLPSGVEPWPAGEREHFVRIIPTLITGWRICRNARG
jgi:hypothetical protein